MATTVTTVHVTSFVSGGTTVRFGLLWGSDPILMTDWARESRFVDIPGPGGFTETQLLGFGPRRATYTLFFDTVADFWALDALQQTTGTLTVVHGGHTVPVTSGQSFGFAALDTVYDQLDGVTLLSLVSNGVAVDGTVEATAVWSRPS